MNEIIANFRKKLTEQDYVYGIFNKTLDPMFIEIQGIANFDFVILDTEHGPGHMAEEQNNVRAALLRGMLPIIRINELNENNVGKALDIGALGVQVPQIQTAEEAKLAVKYARFYPYGERGVCRFVRAADYSAKDRNEYFKESKDLLVILQLEGTKAIENLDEILDVDGVDIIFIGPYDLSQSLGVPGDIKNPLVLNTMIKIVDKAKAKNKVIGTFTDDYEMVAKWKSLGVQYISYSTDSGLFYEYSRDTYNELSTTGSKKALAKVLDCTLRDGGYINDWKFGNKNIKSIVNSLEESNVDFVELGFIAECEYQVGNTKVPTIDILNKYIPKNSNTKYAAMINYGKCDITNIPNYNGNGIKYIRVAFHKKDLIPAIDYCKKIKEKGYKVFVQPMVTVSYTDNEFEYLIKQCNSFKPYAVYVADSFGTMKRREVLHYFKILERLLDNEIIPGFHSHNNMQLSFSNVIGILDEAKREFFIDSSIYGMGRGAGNLNTELLLQYLNDEYDCNYKLEPIISCMDLVINKIYAKTPWGYSLPNYLSASHNAHPNYAKYLIDTNKLSMKDMNSIFDMLDEDKKNEYDKSYIDQIYESYLANKSSNEFGIEKVKALLENRKVSIIAPGKSAIKNIEMIKADKENGSLIISINFMFNEDLVDYIFVGNIKRMESLDLNYYYKVIATSNIPNDDVFAKVNYSKLLNDQEYVKDNSGLMLIKLLTMLNCDITIYGMDGYSYNSEDNYSNNELELTTSKTQIDNLNLGLNIMKKKFGNVKFIK